MTIRGKTIKILSVIGLGLLSCLLVNTAYINQPVNASSKSVDVSITIENYENGKTYGGFNVYLYNGKGAVVAKSLVADQEATNSDHIITTKITTSSNPSSDYKVCFGNQGISETTCGNVSYRKQDSRTGILAGYQAKLTVGQDILTSKYFISANVVIEKTANNNSIYGPLDIELTSNGNSLLTKSTNTDNNTKSTITLKLDEQFGVNDRSKSYKICIADSDKCSGEKTFASGSNVLKLTIKLTAEEYTSITEDTGSSCSISGVGWIVCPVVNFLAGIADGAFNVLSDSFLNISPKLFDTKQSTYTAWSAMRSLANDTGCPCRK